MFDLKKLTLETFQFWLVWSNDFINLMFNECFVNVENHDANYISTIIETKYWKFLVNSTTLI